MSCQECARGPSCQIIAWSIATEAGKSNKHAGDASHPRVCDWLIGRLITNVAQPGVNHAVRTFN